MDRRRFAPGRVVAMREVWRGAVWALRPMTLVRDDDELVATWLPRGTAWQRPWALDGSSLRIPSRPWTLDGQRWSRLDVLQLTPPDAMHSVWVRWDATGAFTGWYVNIQEPLRRTEDGFDTMDLALDIVVAPDRRWAWKDEDDLQSFVDHGLLTGDQADAVRAEGERVVAAIEANASPFCDGWERWRPDPSWTPSRPAAT